MSSLYTIETYRELAPHDQQEWLLTNGLGGFACGTLVGMNTRRYHGLLCAATLPPVGRVMTVNRLGELLTLDSKPEPMLEFSINQFRGAVHPRGDRYLTRVNLDCSARWTYDVEGIAITKELQLIWLGNTAGVRYTIDSGTREFRLALSPMLSLRDFHSLRRADSAGFRAQSAASAVTVGEGPYEVTITADHGRFNSQPDWWYGHVYPVETERGQDDCEDLYTPGQFILEGRGKQSITLWISMDRAGLWDWDAELTRHRAMAMAAATDPENIHARPSEKVHPVFTPKSDTIRKLFHAANDFIVLRKSPDGKPGTSVIAGYPWFADWGRDTMIALPGLLLVTGRFHQARQVLTIFAQYVSQGMIPNRFDDYTNEPEYNTVDASLWFIHAAFEYLKLSHDKKTFDEILHPACRKIVDGYRNGTRYHIHMDPADGLISQGDANTQLTWMDAKCGDVAFTPRQGKPVEINALWYHALVLLNETELAAKVSVNFQKAFWISPWRGLADVVEGTRKDTAIRPNQIFAVSLPNTPLNMEQRSAVVEVVRRELLTPVGLRSLARSDPNYRATYSGNQFQRDGAYHNGTVWSWLIGPFLDAYLKVNEKSHAAKAQARQWLAPLITHMTDQACIGQINEIYDADAPHRPVGCFAQAWSIAEVLRLAVELDM